MPAPFAARLAGYRLAKDNVTVTNRPNTSDSNDQGSITVGASLLEEMGVEPGTAGLAEPGVRLEEEVVADLRTKRVDLDIRRSRSATEFEQYAHLGVFSEFHKRQEDATPIVENLIRQVKALPPSAQVDKLLRTLESAAATLEVQDDLSKRLKLNMPQESLLNVDITCGVEQYGDLKQLLRLALSSKWTLRTDRAQDCVSQGAKLTSQRRGPMPHYGVITMEPRPAMLKILADGSGSVDYVYHLDLPALTRAMEKLQSKNSAKWSPGRTFDRLMQQGRLRDYDDLVRAVIDIPSGHVEDATKQAMDAVRSHPAEEGPERAETLPDRGQLF